MDARTTHVAVLAHCLLDGATRVHGIGRWEGVLRSELHPLVESGAGIVQLPCPEIGYLGMNRWAASREQYDVRAYRSHCRSILAPVVDTLEELVRDGVEIDAVVGVPGSPSCGVFETSEGFPGGAPDGSSSSRRVAGSGVFVQELAAALSERGIEPPFRDAVVPDKE